MNKITRIDKKAASFLQMELLVATNKIAQRYGLIAIPKGGQYDDLQYTAKVQFKVKETVNGKHPNQEDFERHCHWYSLEPTDFGRELILEGQKYIINGVRTNAPKNAICIKRVSDGKTFVTSEETVRKSLGIPDKDPFGIKAEAEAEAKIKAKAHGKLKCKYCKGETASIDPDVLCKECQETFGHTFFSEL